ncbi:MAG: hypothetical protein CBC35_06775 [Planctomycetes bacterium TMED75]|nr:MAG: hypothetical protein CBC35_06775 [Planctomycetes bacterium TMED75]
MVLCLGAFNFGACEPYRIEYRERPSFYKQTSETELLDEVVLEDGTVLRFSDSKNTPPPAPSSQRQERDGTPSAEPISIRTATESGELMLTSYSPEHVLSHIKRGIRLREYQLLWDQVLSNATREAYARDGGDFEDFAAFCDENRSELMQFLNRVGFGIYSSDVVKESFGSSGIRIRLHPSLSSQFKFTQLEIVRESNQLRWLMIR